MRVLVDLLSLGPGGSETYPEKILPRFAGSPHEFVVLLAPEAGAPLRAALAGKLQILDAPGWTRHPAGRHWFQRRRLPAILQERNIGTLFVPGGMTGFPNRTPGVRMVTMARNMLPFMREERRRFGWFSYPRIRGRLELLQSSLVKTFRRADRLICVSEHTAAVVRPVVDPGKCSVIPHGAPEPTADRPDENQMLSRYGIQEPYFLYVSVLDPYKHQLEVLEGFRRIADDPAVRNHQLVLAGTLRPPYGRRVRDAARALGARVVCPGEIPRDHLPALLRRAAVLLFASTCEACPNILLEYLSAGRPVLCSDAAPMPEFGGDAVRYVPPTDPDAWAKGMKELAGDPAARQTLADRARRRATQYSWEKTAAATLDVLTAWPGS